MESIKFTPIGLIRSNFKQAAGTPIQASTARDTVGDIELYDEYVDGLADLDGFSHIILLYYFHLTEGYSLKVIPFLDDQERGIFSTRAPRRPNSAGIAVVELIEIMGNTIHFKGTDMIDGTPVLDIKPYVPEFDKVEASRTGWLEKNIEKLPRVKDDGRFVK